MMRLWTNRTVLVGGNIENVSLSSVMVMEESFSWLSWSYYFCWSCQLLFEIWLMLISYISMDIFVRFSVLAYRYVKWKSFWDLSITSENMMGILKYHCLFVVLFCVIYKHFQRWWIGNLMEGSGIPMTLWALVKYVRIQWKIASEMIGKCHHCGLIYWMRTMIWVIWLMMLYDT